MIKTFKSKELKKLFDKGDSAKINHNFKKILKRRLLWLNNIEDVNDVMPPTYGLHRLKGELSEFYAVKVTGNYRLIFKFGNGNLYDVDFIDYH